MKNKHQEFLALLEPVYPRLSRYARAVTKNREETEDLVSDTVLAALEKFNARQSHENFAGLLFKIASRMHKRRRYRDRFRVSYNQAVAEEIEDRNPSPDKAAEISIIMEALNTLPVKIIETVVLFDVADLSLEEIRQVQGGTISGVKSRLKRGREMLQKQLGIKNEFSVIQKETRSVPLRKSLAKAGGEYAL